MLLDGSLLLERVDGEAAKANRGAEDGRGGALDIVLDDLGDVDANELVALRSIGTEEVAELREEEGNLGLGLSVAQPGFISREDPLAELAFGGGRGEGSSGIEGRQRQRMFHHIRHHLHPSFNKGKFISDSTLAISQTGAHCVGRGSRSQHLNDARTRNELSAHSLGSHISDRCAHGGQSNANLDGISHANSGTVGH